MKCLHCKEAKPLRARGLCYGCWKRHGSKYPKKPGGERSAKILPQCMACNKPAGTTYVQGIGWHSRKTVAFGAQVYEVFCGECFAEYGWGDDLPSDTSLEAIHADTREHEPSPPRVFRLLGGSERARAMGLRF